ncbi:Transposon Ty3-I Gag-Pol polyprotein, partial [Araneus ventricosus]
MEAKSPSALKLEGNVAENWKKFKQKFFIYLEASEKINKPDKLKVALLLTTMGEDCLDIYNSFGLSAEDSEKFDIVIKSFDDYFSPKKNTVIARYKFFNCVQRENESVDSFVTNLKVLAKDCDFETQEENLIRDLLIIGIKDITIKEKLLIESDLHLDQAVQYCRAKESSNQQIQIMTHNETVVNSVKGKATLNTSPNINKRGKIKTRVSHEEEKGNKLSKRRCSKCNTIHAFRKCPAFGKYCHKCHKLNHFATVCRNKKINQVDNAVNADDYEIESNEIKLDSVVDGINSEWKENICINEMKMPCKIDTGAEVNILPLSKFNIVKRKEVIMKTNKSLKSYTGHSLNVLGTCEFLCTYGDKAEVLEFYIVKQNSSVLIGLDSSEKLGFVNRNKLISVIENVDFLKMYNDVFTGTLGKLVYTYDIKLADNAVPRISAPRVIPVSLKEKVKAEIDKMVTNGVLEKVTEPTDWVHPIVVVQKPNKEVRICMDPRGLNKYIKREHYPIPTHQSLFSELEGAKYFSLLDASCAFLQIPLTEESSKLCTIATPFGRYKFYRLPYGLTSSPEVYQKTIENIFNGINGILIYIDDILVYGKTQEEHDAKLKSVLDRARKHGLKLSKDKSKIRVESVKYLGFDLSINGQSINEDKIQALIEYETPKNKAELQRFLGIITFLGKFIPNLSNRTGILRKLLGKNTEFVWSANEQKAFEDLKKCVTNAPVLSFYNKDKMSTISVDASQYGLGAVLLQEDHPIAYASSSLTETQQRYSQTEKELLAIVIGCKKFHYYVYGTKFVIETDHKPLIGLLQKPMDKLSPRLQRMVLELFKYNLQLRHVPGKNLYVEDALSRNPLKCHEDTSFLEAGAAVVHTVLTASDEKTEILKKATKDDPVLSLIRNYIEEGWPANFKEVLEKAKPFWDKKAELHCYNELIFLGNRLVVPTQMKEEILQNLHSAHQGITSCINKASRNVYWPNFCEDIKNFVNSCSICQQHQRANVKETLLPYRVPS